ncbi:O-antigen ligase family protein [Candidatus Omnitrophota bacterium]
MTKLYDRLIESCLIFLIIFTPLALGAVHPWSIAVFEIAAAIMFFLWMLKIFKTGKLEFVRNPVTVFIFLFIGYIVMQLFLPRVIDGRLQAAVPASIYLCATKTELLKMISYALIFFVALNTIKTRQQITRIFSVIIIIGFAMSIFFLMRYFGVNAPRGFINPDHFSAYLGMIIPLAIGLLIGQETGYEKKALLFFSVIIMSATLFLTMSRGGMISFVAAFLIMAGLALSRKSVHNQRWIIVAALIFIILAIAWLGAEPVMERAASVKTEIESRYLGGRLPIWQGTLGIVKDYPVFGSGLGTFRYIFPKYQSAELIEKRYFYAHSDIFELLSETGIVGFSLFAFCCLLFSIWLVSRFYKRHNPWVIGMAIGIFGSLTSIFLHSFTDFNLHIPANAILLAIILPISICVLNYGRDVQNMTYDIRYIKFILCPGIALLAFMFIIDAGKPALANHYAKHSDIADLKRAIKLDPANAIYHYQLGKLYNQTSTLNDRLLSYQKAVELNPTNSKYHQSLAWAYGQLSSLREGPEDRRSNLRNRAHRHFQTAISLEPNYSYRHRTYAIWLFNHPSRENIERGLTEYKKTIALEPGLATEAFNEYYGLTKNYDLLVKIIPDNTDGHIALREYFLEKDLKEKALLQESIILEKMSDEINANKSNKKIYIKAGRIYLNLGRFDKAIEAYNKAVVLGPKDFWSNYWLGVSYNKAHKPNMAVKYLRLSSKLDPASSWPYVNLARIYQNLDKTNEAKEMWQQILYLKDPDPEAESIAENAMKLYR